MDSGKKYLLNKMNSVARNVGLGDLIEAAEDVVSTLADGKVLIGDASNLPAEKTLSGDVTTTREGVVSIGALKVTTAKIDAGAVTLAKLASGVAPSHVVKYAGKATTAGGAAAEVVAVAGVVAGDIVIATLQTKGSTPRTIVTAIPSTDAITVTFSGDPSTDHVVSYLVLRAAA